ncbi:MAG: thermonuclease family protein [Neisseriaceae bacterium]|nr:thermonuclease family protein [Neisseriaceae bacterium]
MAFIVVFALVMKRLLVVLMLCLFSRPMMAAVTCHVLGVLEGDVFTCLTKEQNIFKVRIHEIDAPELNQPYGMDSRKHLQTLIGDADVTLHNAKVNGRFLLADVMKGDVNISYKMVEDGYAWVDRSDAVHLNELDDLERMAQRKNIGLWKGSYPIYPPLWRQDHKDNLKSSFYKEAHGR